MVPYSSIPIILHCWDEIQYHFASSTFCPGTASEYPLGMAICPKKSKKKKRDTLVLVLETNCIKTRLQLMLHTYTYLANFGKSQEVSGPRHFNKLVSHIDQLTKGSRWLFFHISNSWQAGTTFIGSFHVPRIAFQIFSKKKIVLENCRMWCILILGVCLFASSKYL